MQHCKQNPTSLWLLACAVVLLMLFPEAGKARPVRFLTDPISGYALGGIDPVSYFVFGEERRGRSELEYQWQGTRWIFMNEGNRAAFARDPEVYAPQFAGCGAYALSQGSASEGNPAIYAMLDGRIYFFHSVVNRFLFLIGGNTQIHAAQDNSVKLGCVSKR